MNQTPINRRKFVSGSVIALTTGGLVGCGGGDDTALPTSSEPASVPPSSTDGRASILASTKDTSDALASRTRLISTPPGPVFTSLKIHPTQSGVFNYCATVLPLPGQVPAGAGLLSPDDPTLRAAVLSRWNDGSAAVVIASGTATALSASSELSVQIQSGNAPNSEPPLTPERIAKLVSSVVITMGNTRDKSSSIRLTNFATPERIWWATPLTICARYRVSSPNHATLEAVVDVQAIGDRAFVEVVVENGKVRTQAPVLPQPANYSATVIINGTAIATVNSTGAPEGSHTPFRAWYASAWVGGDPGLRVNQNMDDIQKHPLLFKVDRLGGNTSAYAADAYAPWSPVRQRGVYMGGGGDHPSIGPLPQWEARFLQSGSPDAAKATEASTLAILGFNVNYRDSTTGLIPNFADIGARAQVSGSVRWPRQTNANEVMTWETAHCPAAGLMAFIARPSPVYIEIAQKIAVWNGTWSGDSTPNWTSGVFGYWYQTRGKAWGIRSLAHAAFLTPNSDAFRDATLTAIDRNVQLIDQFRANPLNRLNIVWDGGPTRPTDQNAAVGFQQSLWQHHYLATELGKLSAANLLYSAQQALLTTVATWALSQPVRWITEQPNGGWRYLPYKSTCGRDALTVDSAPTWTEQAAWWYTDAPPSAQGPWYSTEVVERSYTSFGAQTSSGGYYPSYFWAALVAAVEHGVPNAAQAWATVQSGITNLSSWRAGFAADPRWGSTPRRGTATPTSTGWGNEPNAGTLNGNLWTPGRDARGVVNTASLALLQVPSGTVHFYEVANTNLDQLDGPVKAAILAQYGQPWVDTGVSKWNGVTDAWVGLAYDTRPGYERAFIGPGGGHAASSNNGLYKYDVRRFTVGIQSLPSPSYIFPPGYQGDTGYPLAASGNSTGGFGYDEIYDLANPNDPVRSSRMPTPRHTYESPVFVPELGPEGSILFACRRGWKYDLATDKWALPKNYLGNATQQQFTSAENMLGYWDALRRRYYHCGNNASNSGDTRNFWWDGADGWGTDGPYPASGWAATSSTRDQIGQIVWVLRYQTADFDMPGNGVKPVMMRRINLDTNEMESFSITLGNSFTGIGFPTAAQSGWYDLNGMTFIDPLNKFLATCVVRINNANQARWCWIDAATWVCELADNIQGAWLPPTQLEGKIKYFKDARVLVHFTSANQNLRMARCV